MSEAMPADIIVGVDTHKHTHAAVALTGLGARVAELTIQVGPAGYRELEAWARSLGVVRAFGVEGTGSYGAGLARFLREGGHVVHEVGRPDRRLRRQRGKTDHLDRLTERCAPEMVAAHGVGSGTAAEMLVLVGDDPERIRSEAAFAKLCGACPIPASSGKTSRHRLNRGGHRQANAALHRVVVVRMRTHQPTVDYVRRRTAEGKSKREIIRCLKRFVAREIFGHLCRPPRAACPERSAA